MMMRPEHYARFSSCDEQRAQETPALALELASGFVDMGVAVAGVKCGALGYCVVTGDRDRIESMGRARPLDSDNWSGRRIWSPSYRADVIKSATGAGDSSIAGFLMSLACGQSLETAANAACAVGWQNLRAVDAFSGVGTAGNARDDRVRASEKSCQTARPVARSVRTEGCGSVPRSPAVTEQMVLALVATRLSHNSIERARQITWPAT